MVNVTRMTLLIPGKLSIRLKEVKAQYKMNYAQIFVLLISQIPRPDEFQSDYIMIYPGKPKINFDIRMTDEDRLKINTFAAAFKNLYNAIDYLLVQEKKIRMNRTTIV